jgi:RNA polymerase sigma factor (sigma-70 family)
MALIRASCASMAVPRPHSPAELLFHQFHPLAESIARSFHYRGHRVIELDDCRQVAAMALWQACNRIQDPVSAPAYLSRCIRGALLHHARDLGRTIRVSRRAQENPGTSYPWVLASLDQLLPSGDGTLLDLIIDQASETSNESHDSVELLALIDRLPAQQAAVLRLRHLEGLGCREASRQLGISHTSVSRYEQQALAQLRQVLVG